MRFRTMLATMTVAIAVAGARTVALGQDRGMPVDVASRGPLFLARGSGTPAGQWVDVSNAAIFRRRITVNLRHVSRERALAEITRQGGLRLTYSAAAVRLDVSVTLVADDITVGAALSAVLYGAGVDVLLTENGRAALVQRTIPLVIRQHGTLVGAVTDSATHRGVGSVEIFLSGTPWHTTTDTGGRYRLADIDTGAYTLTARRLGYAKQSRRVTVRENREDTVDVVLPPVVARLNELVTTATGQRRRLDIANDVTTINADSVMQAAPIRSLTDLLDGRVPGLTIQRTSGAPGDPARIRARGASSPLKSNDPIVIVDGVRVYSEQSAARSGNLANQPVYDSRHRIVDVATGVAGPGVYAAPSPLDYIDPNTIDKIEVLKGPSAATLYGPDAANGVIVITTKKGRPGPARWTASLEHGRTTMEGAYPQLLLRAGRSQFDDAFTFCPITNEIAVIDGVAPCTGDSLVPFQVLNDPALTVLDHGRRSALSLGVSGGTQGLTYQVTGSYSDEAGLIKLPTYEADRYQTMFGLAPPDWMQRPQHFKQWGVRGAVAARLGTKADLSFATGLSRVAQQRSSLEQQLGDLMTTYLDQSSGIYYRGDDGYVANAFDGDLLTGYYRRATATATTVINSLNLTWRPQAWLTVTSDAGLNVIDRHDQVYFPRGPRNDLGGINDTTGYVTDAHGTSVVSTVNLRANAGVPLRMGFQFQFAAGLNYRSTRTNDLAGQTSRLAPGSSIQGSESDFVRQAEASDATFGWYAEPSIGNNKINFSSGIRLDGGSSYGSGVNGLRLPKFPKLGLSYVVSEEPWFPFKGLVQSLRLRVAYGRASRQPDPTDRLRLYGLPQVGYADGQFRTIVSLQTLGNTEVRPERSTEFEGGLDADFLDNRVTLIVTGYRKTTSDALLAVPVGPSVYGSGVSIIKNIGMTRNTGLELSASAQLVRSGPVTWQTEVRMAQDRNVVVELGPGVEPFYTSLPSSAGGAIRVAPGYPLFGRWSLPILGYADANANGILEPSEVQLGDTAVYVGATVPNYTANLGTTLSFWRGALTVNVGFEYQDGLSQRNNAALHLAFFSPGRQDPAATIDEQASVVDMTGVTDYNWIQTVSTMRFKNMSVNYRVPAAVAHILRAQQIDVAVQGSNLGLWTNYRGLDPNVNAFGTGNNVTDTGILPQPRTWQVRIHAAY